MATLNERAGGEHRPHEAAPVAPHREMSVTTLTPVLNEELHIRATVAALQAQDVAAEAEFVFIDGRSTDRTRAILEELAAEDNRIRILDNPQRQTASALNIGLRAARGEYVARIDAHTRYPPQYLSRGIERLQAGDVDWVTGPQIPVGTNAWSQRVAIALGSRLGTGSTNRWDRDVQEHGGREVELGTSVFTGVWRRETLERDGGWDEGWPINQDAEMASRVLHRGGRIVSLPELGAEYVPRSSLRTLARQYRGYGTYRAKTALRHPRTVGARHILLPGIVMAPAASVAAPRAIRLASRTALAAYAVGVLLESVRAGTKPRDKLALPLVFVTMHVSWGGGLILGLLRFAKPSARRLGLADDLMAGPGTG